MSNTAIGGPRSIRPCADILLRRRLGTINPSRQAAGRRFRKRFAAARQAWIGHEGFARVERRLAVGGLDTGGRTVGQERLLRIVGDDGPIRSRCSRTVASAIGQGELRPRGSPMNDPSAATGCAAETPAATCRVPTGLDWS